MNEAGEKQNAFVPGQFRILIAEDNLVNQYFMETLIQEWGFQTVTASDGQQVLKLLETGSFDMILMDIQMPIMNGIEAVLQIRQNEKDTGKHIPIIVVTGYNIESVFKDIEEDQIEACMIKPIIFDDLHEKVCRFLDKKNFKT